MSARDEAHESAFIVLEGIDGSGTTTQVQLLYEELLRRVVDQEVVKTREPYDPVLTKRIRAWLAEPNPPWEALLHAFILDRHVHLRELVIPALDRGAVVICDRYKLSTLVYQPKHNDRALVEQLCDNAIDPDLYVLLDIDASIASVRMASRSATKDAYERDIDFQREIAADYNEALDAETKITGVPAVTINVDNLSILDVHYKVVEAVCEQLGF